MEYIDLRQGSCNAHQFAIYLRNLEDHLPQYTEKQRTLHYFSKLRKDLRNAISNHYNILKIMQDIIVLAYRMKQNQCS